MPRPPRRRHHDVLPTFIRPEDLRRNEVRPLLDFYRRARDDAVDSLRRGGRVLQIGGNQVVSLLRRGGRSLRGRGNEVASWLRHGGSSLRERAIEVIRWLRGELSQTTGGEYSP